MSRRNKSVAFIAFFVILNLLLSFIIEPARSASGFMWESYYEQEDIDMIFVGSSLCQGAFDPAIIDERLNVNSFNMGTPLQAVPQSISAVETAIKEHDIKTVIFGMSFSTLKAEEVLEAEMTFEKARIRKKGFVENVVESIRYLFSNKIRNSEKSMVYFFPWMYNREDLSISVILNNIKMKLQHSVDESSTFYKGFQNHPGVVFNYDNVWETNSSRYHGAKLNEKMMASLEELMILCKKHEVDLMVVNTPHPFFDVISCYRYYEQNQNEVIELCSKYDVDYYDFSLAKKEIFDAKTSYYSDYEHLNLEGAEAFSEQLCDFLIRRERGEQLEEEFYSLDEFLELYDVWLEEWKSYYW